MSEKQILCIFLCVWFSFAFEYIYQCDFL
jgi:hypothetical protein